MTEALFNGAAVMLGSVYPGLTGAELKQALDAACGGGGPDLTIKETCELLKRCRASVRNDIAAGRLETFKIGGAVRVRRASINRLLSPQN